MQIDIYVSTTNIPSVKGYPCSKSFVSACQVVVICLHYWQWFESYPGRLHVTSFERETRAIKIVLDALSVNQSKHVFISQSGPLYMNLVWMVDCHRLWVMDSTAICVWSKPTTLAGIDYMSCIGFNSPRPSHAHDDVIKWKYFPSYWFFVRESTGHRLIPSQRPATRSLDALFDVRPNKRLGDLRRDGAHFNVTVIDARHMMRH